MILNEKRELIDISNNEIKLSLRVLRKLLEGDEVTIKRIKDLIQGSKEFNIGHRSEFFPSNKDDPKALKNYAKAKKMLQIKMTGFLALLKSKLNLEDGDIKERGDISDKPLSNFYIRLPIENDKVLSSKEKDFECGKVRKIIGSIFKEGRGYWDVMLDYSGFEKNGEKYKRLHVIFKYDKYIKEVLLGKRFEQLSSIGTYFNY